MACFLHFRTESILVVTLGISHEVFVLFRATNHESVAWVVSSGRCVLIAWRKLHYSLSVQISV